MLKEIRTEEMNCIMKYTDGLQRAYTTILKLKYNHKNLIVAI